MVDPSQQEISVTGGSGPGEIRDLHVEFVIPDGGRFGRDKNVPMSEATAAKVSYAKDGRPVRDQVVTVTEAQALVTQAEADSAADIARRTVADERRQARAAEVNALLRGFSCPVCGGRSFEEHLSREDSQWGITSFRMRLLICRECAYVSQFALGRSLFVPG
jgi:hypothetical protein